MRRMIPLVAILLALFAGAATAEIGLVADIDGDYTNGPDTLLADPGDTVQVNIWITGDDSLVAFGVTLGDTSGALVWIEEPESLVYTTPSGWADIPVPQDSLGWLMIQSTDFTGSVPLILPSKVAEMDFVVAPGESCGIIVFDPEMSGWQNSVFIEGAYSEPTTGTACDWSMHDGGDFALPNDSTDDGGESLSVSSLPIDSATGRSLVSPEDWSTFPVLRTELHKGTRESPIGPGAYIVYFRRKPALSVEVVLVSEGGQVLGISEPSNRTGTPYVAVPTSKSPDPHFGDIFVDQVYDEEGDTVLQANLPDTAFAAQFDFSADFTTGNLLIVLVGGDPIFGERISPRIGTAWTVTPEIRRPTADERYTRYIAQRVAALRSRGAAETEIQRLRENLEGRRSSYVRRSK